ncbi:sensor histidine kinase [Microbulbifer variabilis]|uniref:sensor histidine kinase n=1 Tax=Microbulbifer variabilis TaxID=266805 RepID=UPI001CFC8F25|nr:histidine kinase [Microbulbifer variabilis]
MDFLKSPTPSVKFLSYHFGGWAIFSLVNTFSLGLLTQDHLDKIAIHIVTVVLTVGLSTLIVREIIYRFNLFDKSWYQQWGYLLSASIFLGYICACIAVSIIYAYYKSEGYIVIRTFWEAVFDSWLILILLMLTWSLIYLATVNQDRLRKAEQDATQLKLQLNEVKMSALMGQLNPHFLFNGLNNIRALILEDTTRSREMLTNLSDLLRYTLLAHKHKTVPLRDELEIVCQYIELIKIQYEERLSFTLDVNNDLLSKHIPPLLIQLLAENAVRHGIEKTKQGGELVIRVHKENDNIAISVSNPGTLKMGKSVTSMTEYDPSGDVYNRGAGLGLINIKKRLAIQYGDESKFEIKQQGAQVIALCFIPESPLQCVV